MKLILLTLGLHPDLDGGAYRYVADLASEFSRRGTPVEVICPAPHPGLPAEETTPAGYRVLRYPDARGPFWWNWPLENVRARQLLRRCLRDGESRVILAHAFLAPCLAGMGLRDVWSLFTGPWAEEFLAAHPPSRMRTVLASMMRSVERQALRHARGILTLSQYCLRKLPLWQAGLSLPPAHEILGGVDVDRFQPLSAERRAVFRHQMGWSAEDQVFLTVRRLAPRMGLESLLEAFRPVAESSPRARLILVGRGSLQPVLQAIIDQGSARFRQAVQLAGFVPEDSLAQWMGAADVHLMPSLDLEGFGLATVESLACGVPVLGSDAGATPEVLAPWVGQCILPAGEVASWSQAMIDLLEGRRVLPDANACRKRVLECYTWPRVVDRILSIPAWT